MTVIRAKDIKETIIPKPYERSIKVMCAPDVNDVPELNFNLVLIKPGSKTDLHDHDRPELIYIIAGRGEATLGDQTVSLESDVVIWVRKNKIHQIRNTGTEIMKMATLFVPGYTKDDLINARLEAAKK